MAFFIIYLFLDKCNAIYLNNKFVNINKNINETKIKNNFSKSKVKFDL